MKLSRNKTLVPAKNFHFVHECCSELCCLKFSNENQQLLFTAFYSKDKKQLQDLYLSSCMEKVLRKTQVLDSLGHANVNQWKYTLSIQNIRVPVCRRFIISLYGISVERIRTVQQKNISGNHYVAILVKIEIVVFKRKILQVIYR